MEGESPTLNINKQAQGHQCVSCIKKNVHGKNMTRFCVKSAYTNTTFEQSILTVL